jgi:Glycosyl hydrolases family 28
MNHFARTHGPRLPPSVGAAGGRLTILATALLGLLALQMGCGREKAAAPEGPGADGTGGDIGSGGSTVAVGTGGRTGSVGSSLDTTGYPTSCDDIGAEPVIPPASTTLLATKASSGGVLADEATADTKLIQDAINACPAGQSVRLAADGANNAFLSGPLFMKAGVTLWIDAGMTLFASRNPRDFDAKVGQCGGNGTGSSACNALINVRTANVGVMGAGVIDGRGGQPLTGVADTWWTLENLYSGNLAAPRLIQVTSGTKFTLYQVTLRNSAKFHVVIENTNGFVVWGTTINTPATAPNTDGIDPSASTNGVMAYNKITTGDDNIAIKGSGPPTVDNLIVAHNHFGKGHGMSIGSETYGGVRNVKVCDLSLDGTTNGLRIKSDSSRGGLVQGISYTDVCMRSVTNPLVFDPYYSTSIGTRIPDYRDIVAKDVHVVGGGKVRLRGYDAAHPLDISLDNVVFDVAPTVTAANAHITLGPRPSNLTASGTDVTLADQMTGTASAKACDTAWVTF